MGYCTPLPITLVCANELQAVDSPMQGVVGVQRSWEGVPQGLQQHTPRAGGGWVKQEVGEWGAAREQLQRL